MKNFYIVINIKENEKYYAYAVKISTMDNLLSKLEIPNIYSANFFGTKKHTDEIVKSWNDAYKANGTYLFDNPSF
jgi:hypothetical protein